MQTLSIKCRVCKKKTKHGDLDANHEMKLGDGISLVQCLACGVMGIERIEVKDNGEICNS
jgi:hypothetical protein